MSAPASPAAAPPAGAAAPTAAADAAALSKRQARRLRRAEKAESRRAFQKRQRAAKAAAAAAARRAEIEARLATMTDEERAAWRAERDARRGARRSDDAARKARLAAAAAGGAPLRIVIDCGYNELMTEREAASLGQQLRHCVAANARAAPPVLLAWAGVAGPTAATIDGISGSSVWPVVRLPALESGQQIVDGLPRCTAAAADAPSTTPIYLSADAADELDDGPLPPGTTLIIGGLVDRNRYPRAALDRAVALNVPAARLPLRLALTSSAVLTVDCVFGMLVRVAGGATWSDAAAAAVPKRKQKDGGGGQKED